MILKYCVTFQKSRRDDITKLDSRHRMLGFAMLIVFVLLFTPIAMMAY